MTPLQAALDVLDRAQGLLTLDPGGEQIHVREYDIRRQAHSMGVAALDTWMHWAIHRVDLDQLSPRLTSLEVPFGALVQMGDHSLMARKRRVKDRPRVRARNVLNEKLLTMTFQTGRQWEYGFNLLGVAGGLTRAGRALQPPLTNGAVQRRLNELSHRRNCIVHEGDLRRQTKPRRVIRSKLPRAQVDNDLTWIRAFLTAVDGIV